MASVAIIHAAEDALPARALAEKLRQAKLTVVLEKQPGEDLRGAVKDARVTVALWSPKSVTQPALIEDAGFARGKSKVVHVTMQNAAVPGQFSGEKPVNLTGWRGEDDFAAWRELAKQVTDKAGVAPMPPPAPKPPSGFFTPGAVGAAAHQPQAAPSVRQPQQGRVVPQRSAAAAAQRAPQAAPQQQRPQQAAPQRQQQQAAPRPAPAQRAAPTSSYASADAPKKSGGGMMIGIIAFVAVAALGGGGYWFWSQQQGAQATSTAWESVDRGDADALRAFISGDPGDFRDEAQTALAELEERSYEAASDTDTIDALEGFLNDFPDSEHAIAARGRIAELQTLTPAAGDPAAAPDAAATPDPDLVPPAAASTETGAGPAAITPPAEPAPEPAPDLPTN